MIMIDKEFISSLAVLKNNGTILYPTDTIWGIGSDATNEIAVSIIYKIKQRNESKSLIILVDSFEMLQNYVDKIPSVVKSILSENEKPITIIYSHPINLAKNIIASNNTVAIRVVQNEFCKSLIKQFGKPIVSTSANLSGEATPKIFSEISKPILESVDYIVNLEKENINLESSSIVRILDDNSIEVNRA
jgi:L-threonylcarbamoyladenylate synthase